MTKVLIKTDDSSFIIGFSSGIDRDLADKLFSKGIDILKVVSKEAVERGACEAKLIIFGFRFFQHFEHKVFWD